MPLDKLFGILVGLAVISACTLGKPKVPLEVMETFTQKYPNAANMVWEMESEIAWEVAFENNGQGYSANFSADGIWKETEEAIEERSLPERLRSYLRTTHPHAMVKEIERVETPDGLFYELEIEQKGRGQELWFTSEGELLESPMENTDENAQTNDQTNNTDDDF